MKKTSCTVKCTLLIPTHNRHSYLERIFEYYNDERFSVVCCDSSSSKYPKPIPDNVVYLHKPNILFVPKVCDAFNEIKTKFVVLCADDDFVLKERIIEGVEFLNNNIDYSCVIGKRASFNKKFTGIFNFSNTLNSNRYIINNNPIKNMKGLMRNYYQVLYSITRSTDAFKAFNIANKSKILNDNFIELIHAAFIAYTGKINILDFCWNAREQDIEESWGGRWKSLCLEDKAIVNSSIENIELNFDKETEAGAFQSAVNSYMEFCIRYYKKTLKINNLPNKTLIKLSLDKNLVEVEKLLYKYNNLTKGNY